LITDDLGHRGPLTVSLNNTYRICDLLIEASAELGVPENPCYNSGVNNGWLKVVFSICYYNYVIYVMKYMPYLYAIDMLLMGSTCVRQL